MYTFGHKYIPAPVHAGGLRYHGASPSVSHLLDHGVIEAEAYTQHHIFDSAAIFTKAEGIIPAPESAHAIASTIEQARKYPKDNSSEGPTILFNLSGHGLFDLYGYQKYLRKELDDFQVNKEQVTQSLTQVPNIS